MIKQLEAQRGIKASPEYIYTLSQSEVAVAQPEANAQADKPLGDPAQYTPGKLRLQLAHGLAKGDQVLVAVIDSGVDTAHPEFAGVIADSFDTSRPGRTAACPWHCHRGRDRRAFPPDGGRAIGKNPRHPRLRGIEGQRRRHHLQHSQEHQLGGEQGRPDHQYELRGPARSRARSAVSLPRGKRASS